MERRLMQAMRATSHTAYQSIAELVHWELDFIDYFSKSLDANKYYDQLKAYKQAKNDISLMMDDLQAIASYFYKEMKNDIASRVQKSSRMRPKDQWDIDIVNSIVMSLETCSVLIADLIEMQVEANVPELSRQFLALSNAPAQLQAFKDSPFTQLCKALDEANRLALTDRVIEVNDVPEQSKQNDLLIRLGANVKLDDNETAIFKSVLKKLGVEDKPVVYDFNSKLKVAYELAKEMPAGTELVPFKSEFMIKSLNRELGEATGIVMPAGSLERRYLDGDYFPEDVVRMSMIGWIINSPQINRDHEEKDLFNFWEHPHFRIVETWQERTGFMLGGEKVMAGDWCATIRAVTDESREGLMSGLFNGFSVEGFVTYYPDELLSSTAQS